MANFKTHVAVAAAVSTLAAGFAVAAELVSPAEGLVCAALGTIGGILPDVDADHSVPTRIIFTLWAGAVAFAIAQATYGRYAPGVVALACVLGYLLIRHGAWYLMARLCTHRGLIHSLPAATIVGAGAALVGTRAAQSSPTDAWIYGTFLAGGFVIHLALDELFSVDLLNARVKRSFGTALKLGSRRAPLGTALLYACLLATVMASPPIDDFVRRVFSARTLATARANLGGLLRS